MRLHVLVTVSVLNELNVKRVIEAEWIALRIVWHCSSQRRHRQQYLLRCRQQQQWGALINNTHGQLTTSNIWFFHLSLSTLSQIVATVGKNVPARTSCSSGQSRQLLPQCGIWGACLTFVHRCTCCCKVVSRGFQVMDDLCMCWCIRRQYSTAQRRHG